MSETKFDWSWDQFELSKDLLQKLIYMESLYFHPDQPVTVTAPNTGVVMGGEGSGEKEVRGEEGEDIELKKR